MGFKCVPQILGLVRGNVKPGQKHRGNAKAVIGEGGKDRITASPTYDPSRSDMNLYEGYESGYACADDMVKRADEYVQEVHSKTKNGEEVVYTRTLRADAVIGWALIINPSDEMTEGWSFEDYERFDKDAWDCMCQIEPRLFRDDTVQMKAWHFDEGIPTEFTRPEVEGVPKNSANYLRSFEKLPSGHTHRFGDSIDKDGRYCGNLITRKLYEKVNIEFAAKMREKGWNLDDPSVTDWKKFYERDEEGKYVNEEYRKERRQVLKRSGRTNAQYVYDQAVKTAENASEMSEIAKDLADEAGERMLQADVREQAAEQAIADANQVIADAEAKVIRLSEQREMLEREVADLESEWNERKSQRDAFDERFTECVRFMRGSGHEEDEIEVPTETVSIAEMLREEYQAMQERMLAERQVLFSQLTDVLKKLKDSSDTDMSRKRFMELHRDKNSGRSFEEIYQQGVEKKRDRDREFLREARRLAQMQDDYPTVGDIQKE